MDQLLSLHAAPSETAMRMLCLVADAERGQRLLVDWQALAPGARCQICHDGIEALFVTAPTTVDWLLLDPASIQPHRAAWLASWRRLAPLSRVIELDADAGSDATRLRVALAGAYAR
ncbi:MAG TPA: hypothetical protein VNV16_08635 [Methylibium sp.]|nr:hypothetical protein [Methylibium sp.]